MKSRYLIRVNFFAAWSGSLACAQLFWPEVFRAPFYTSLPMLFYFLAATVWSNSKRLDALEKAAGHRPMVSEPK